LADNHSISLSQRRDIAVTQRDEFSGSGAVLNPRSLSKGILSSWRRSAKFIKSEKASAPVDEDRLVSDLWQESPLCKAAKIEQDNMKQLTKEGELVVAISDPCGRLLWTHSSSYMKSRAENLNFVAGGHWDEKSVGTNAVGLSLKEKKPVTVFSAEHYSPFVEDWVCYAAPIIHPQSKQCIGILDMSTTWDRHTPLGQAAVSGIARSIANCLPTELPKAELEIHALGEPYIVLKGIKIHVSLRQLEILSLLALNPEGLSLERLHAALYGDARVSTATLKAEISHLRHMLNGEIGSRPYRLTLSFWADFVHLWGLLHQQKTNEAMSLYRGSLLPQSQSPELIEWRYCISAVMEQALETCRNPEVLIKRLHQDTSRSQMMRERLLDILS